MFQEIGYFINLFHYFIKKLVISSLKVLLLFHLIKNVIIMLSKLMY